MLAADTLMCHDAGLFIPSLALGASWGRMIGMIVRHAAGPTGPSISLASYAVGFFSFMGMVVGCAAEITSSDEHLTVNSPHTLNSPQLFCQECQC